MQIEKGQRLKLADVIGSAAEFAIELIFDSPDLSVDFACFGVDAAGKLSDDRYLTFFNQPATPCGAVSIQSSTAKSATFAFALARLPQSLERLVLTAAIDGAGAMRQLRNGAARILVQGREVGKFSFTGADFAAERALMLADIYRKDGQWRFAASAQGFNGGMDALVLHFGASLAEATTSVPPAAPQDDSSRVNLEKRIAAQAPQLVNLVKKVGVSLEKVGLAQHRAKVCLCLDISGSMKSLYGNGAVQKLAERVLALACRFDDDGEIDVFLFGAKVHQPAAMSLDNCNTYIKDIRNTHALESDTRYGLALEAIRTFYFGSAPVDKAAKPASPAALPVYVMFVTDGSTSDGGFTEKQIRASSYEPIFWQFMGIGKGRKSKAKKFAAFASSDFPMLEKLDELPGRLIDNAGFFSVLSPDEYADEALYDIMMEEYPEWLKQAKEKGLLAR